MRRRIGEAGNAVLAPPRSSAGRGGRALSGGPRSLRLLERPKPEAHADTTERRGARDLALRAGQGDPDALTELVRSTSAYVWSVCARLVDRESADDLAQDTYVRAVRSLGTYRGQADPMAWLAAIARRVCADEIARRQRVRHLEARARIERPTEDAEVAVSVELADAIARLAPQRREAFYLTVIAGFSYAEAAAVCDCPVGTIRSRVARAKRDLSGALESQADQNGPPRFGNLSA